MKIKTDIEKTSQITSTLIHNRSSADDIEAEVNVTSLPSFTIMQGSSTLSV